MRTSANNAFSKLLSLVSTTAPRKTSELKGLGIVRCFGPSLVYAALPITFFVFGFPLLMFIIQNENGVFFPQSQSASGRVLSVETSLPIPERQNEEQQPFHQYSVVKYAFVARSQTYYGAEPIAPDSVFAELKSGAPLPIRYNPAKPEDNKIAGASADSMPAELFVMLPLLFILMICIFFLPAMAPTLRHILRARKIYKRGTLTIGEVSYIAPSKRLFFQNYYIAGFDIMYSFPDAAGKIQTGHQLCENIWLIQKLEVGTELTVIFLPKNPRESIVLEPFIA